MPSVDHLAVIAAAGSHKTEFIVNSAVASNDKRVLVTTYTNANLACIEQRIYGKAGRMPKHITVMSWYQFLANQWCRPYQRALLNEPGLIRGLDFRSNRSRYVRESDAKEYYTNRRGELYKDWTAGFAVKVNAKTGGAPLRRLEAMFDEIYIDEAQDLVGYDLDVLDLLLDSPCRLVMVGDPRQHTYATNDNRRHQKYRGDGFIDWINERAGKLQLETRDTSYRCNQAICDFADALYPDLPRTRSENHEVVDSSGILMLNESDTLAHVARHNTVNLRWDKRTDTLGLDAMNFGVSKGSTFERVVIFTNGPIRDYLDSGDPAVLKPGTKSKLYVAITRAKHSVVFVV
jgi:ATP-dependent DNA helicase UvrD/PcrA